MPDTPALSAASQEAVAEVERKLGAGYSMSQATLYVVARLAALEADVQRNREQVEQSAGMLMALRTENAELRQQVAEWRLADYERDAQAQTVVRPTDTPPGVADYEQMLRATRPTDTGRDG